MTLERDTFASSPVTEAQRLLRDPTYRGDPEWWQRLGVTGWAIIVAVVAVILLAMAFGNHHNGAPSVTYDTSPEAAQSECRHFVTLNLLSPSTAKFSAQTSTEGSFNPDGTGGLVYTVTGTVDADNAFGAPLRREYACELLWQPEIHNWHLTSLTGL